MGIRLVSMNGLMGNPISQVQELENVFGDGALVYHYVDPSVMHWMYARLHSSPTSRLRRLRLEAFDDAGCCRKCQRWIRKECRAKMPVIAFPDDSSMGTARSIAARTDEYIAFRDKQLQHSFRLD